MLSLPKHLARIIEEENYYHTQDASASLSMTFLYFYSIPSSAKL
jgi:hypothetical protein